MSVSTLLCPAYHRVGTSLWLVEVECRGSDTNSRGPSDLWILNVEQSFSLTGVIEPGLAQPYVENWLRMTYKKYTIRAPEVYNSEKLETTYMSKRRLINYGTSML